MTHRGWARTNRPLNMNTVQGLGKLVRVKLEMKSLGNLFYLHYLFLQFFQRVHLSTIVSFLLLHSNTLPPPPLAPSISHLASCLCLWVARHCVSGGSGGWRERRCGVGGRAGAIVRLECFKENVLVAQSIVTAPENMDHRKESIHPQGQLIYRCTGETENGFVCSFFVGVWLITQ